MRFEEALAFVLSEEGGISNDSQDPGGLTKFGISSVYYPQVKEPSFSRDDAAQIYRTEFWNRFQCDRLPPGMDLLVFDCGVNQTQQCIRLLQRSLRITADGVIGTQTLTAARSCGTPELIMEFVAQRAQAYAQNPIVQREGLGWFRRLSACHQLALKGIQ